MKRLPAAERSLIVAKVLHIRGDMSGIDTLRAHVARYPEDATGWYLLADAQLHAFMLTGMTPDELYQPFDRALDLDPSFVPDALHPLELSVMLDDSARFNRYISQLDSVELGSATFWRAASDVRWGPRTARLSVLAGALRNDAYAPDNRIRPLLQIASSESPETAIRILRMLTWFEPAYSLLFAVPLAEAYERAGMTAEAARTRSRYIAVLEQGDPEVQPYVEAARRALERLAAERAL